jgi:hypothetical protein
MSSFNPQDERQQARDFVLHYLKDDGVFLTRLLSLNSSDLVVTELINQLWLRYKTASRFYSIGQHHDTHVPNNRLENNATLNIDQSRSRLARIPLPILLTTSQGKQEKSSKDTDV